jgi:23S rRNA G2445 N2-methylase RlmL
MTRLRDALAEQTGLAAGEAEGDLLVRVRPTDNAPGWDVLVRLGPRPHSTRPWRACNLPGALNATVARAMAQSIGVADGDRLLNAACGSATLMVESARTARLALCAGVDIDKAHLACARRNLAAADIGRPHALIRADAGALPLRSATFDKVLADLPFGKLVGTHADNDRLYPAFLTEAARVARSGARMAVVTHEIRLFERSLTDTARWWRADQTLRIKLGPMHPRIFVLTRTTVPPGP